MKKRSCYLGYGCGGVCITAVYMCRKDYAEEVSVSINGLRKVVRDERSRRDKEIDLRTSVTAFKDRSVNYTYISKNPNGGLKKVEVMYDNDPEKKLGGINFKVNDSYESRGGLSKAEKVEAAKAVKRMVDRMLKSEIAEDTYIAVTAYDGDGKMKSRQKAYVNQGFNQEEGSNFMTARVSRGKFFPISYEQYRKRSPSYDDEDFDFEDLGNEEGDDWFSERKILEGINPDFRNFYVILFGEEL